MPPEYSAKPAPSPVPPLPCLASAQTPLSASYLGGRVLLAVVVRLCVETLASSPHPALTPRQRMRSPPFLSADSVCVDPPLTPDLVSCVADSRSSDPPCLCNS